MAVGIFPFLKVNSTVTNSCLEVIQTGPEEPGITGARGEAFCRDARVLVFPFVKVVVTKGQTMTRSFNVHCKKS